MKQIITVFFSVFIFTSCISTKLKSYGTLNNTKFATIHTQAEVVLLNIEKPKKKDTIKLQTLSLGEGIILEEIVKIPEYLGKIIKYRKRKYNQSYSGSNSLDFTTSLCNLPKLNLTRKIFADKKGFKGGKIALDLKFTPIAIDSSLFTFKLDSTSAIFYTKAKTTKKHPFVNLSIIIKANYFEKDNLGKINESTITSKPIIIPLKQGVVLKDIIEGISIKSSPFKITNLKNIKVQINETNPYFLKLKELESDLDDNNKTLIDLLTKLTNALNKN